MKTILPLLIFICMGITIYAQNNFYVATNGDDSNPGSLNQPWETIQYAMDVASPGSTVFIMAGTYSEKVYVNVSGSSGNFITFRNFENDEVIIDGTGWNDPAICEIYDQQYIRLQGLHFKNNIQNDAMGIFIEGMCSNIEIIGCTISEIHFSADPNAPINENTNAQPLIVYGSLADFAITNLLIQDCEIYNSRTGYSEALAVNGNIDGFEISGNEVHDITNIGIDAIGHEGTCPDPAFDQARNGYIDWNTVYNCLSPYASSAGIYIDGASNIYIENNMVFDNQWGIEVGCENPGKTASAIVVRNNFVYGNSSGGIQLGGYDYPSGSGYVTDCMIVNNSLFNNATLNNYDGELTLTYSENCTIVNNIFYSNNPEGQLISLEDVVAVPPGLSFDYNLWYHPDGAENTYIYWNGTDYDSFDAFISGTGFESSANFIDPLFKSTNTSDPNLHLTEDSPAIGAANTNWLTEAGNFDIDDEARVNESLDSGADEFHVSSGIFEKNQPTVLSVFPNPARETVFFKLPQEVAPDGILEIFTSEGKMVDRQTIQNMTRLSVKTFKPGLYLAVFRTSEQTLVSKLRVE
ncbi:MAG: right-handed parallel beta-helix repeat-containing protein [Bacteroidales bacterium]|nr:right-handed parallel beta-helix repeat-containing protein [Bacteroidales bacterium]